MNPKIFYQRYCNTPIKKGLFWLINAFGGLFLLLIVVIYLMQGQIIQRFVKDVNKHLAVKVEAPHINVSAIANFPAVSIAFDQLVIYESNTKKPDTLAHFDVLYFTFNAWDLINGHYQLHQLYAENGAVHLKTSSQGVNNFEITKPSSEKEKPNEHFTFHLNRIRLKNVDLDYDYQKADQIYALHFDDMISNLTYQNQEILIALDGSALINQIMLGKQTYAEDKKLTIGSQIQYQLSNQSLKLFPSSMEIGRGSFQLEGSYQPQDKEQLDIQLEGQNATFKTLLAFCPESVRKQLEVYQTKGHAYFSASVEGSLENGQQPSIHVDFGCKDVSLTHPELGAKIDQLQFKGTFDNGKQRKLSSSSIQLDSISGSLEGNVFQGRFGMSNFVRPLVNAHVKTNFELKNLLTFYPIDEIEQASALVDTDLEFSGDLASKWNFKATGSVSMKDFSFKSTQYPHTVYIDSTQIQLSQQVLTMKPTRGKVAESDFALHGTIKHWHKLLVGKWMDIVPSFKLQSENLNLDQLLPKSKEQKKGNTQGGTINPPFTLTLSIKNLLYDGWHAKQVRGAVHSSSANQFRLTDLSAQIFGGNIGLNGLLELGDSSSLYAGTVAMKQVDISTLFQSFDDFGQTAISHQNLSGSLTANLSSQLIFDASWSPKWEHMDAVIAGKITNGKLLNYEPMKRMALFMQNKDLEKISFSELSDTIFINNNTMTLPRMEIQSSIGNMFVSGVQEIDGEMEYHVQVPLKNFKKPDKDEAFGAIEDDGLGNGNLFLVITGTPDDYKIGYDKKEVIQKIKDDLKKEKKEFSSLFKKKQKAKQVGLKDDYF